MAILDFQVIQTIVLHMSCPRAVLRMTGRAILRLIDEPTLRPVMQSASFDDGAVKQKICQTLDIEGPSEISVTVPPRYTGLTSFSALGVQLGGPFSLRPMLTQAANADYTLNTPPSLTALSVYPPKQVLSTLR